MLQRGQVLATWRLARLPVGLKADDKVPAEELPDHRLAYLDYQGPLSRNRGTVRRVDRGRYDLLSRNRGGWTVRLRGRRLRGRFRLRRIDGACWLLARAE